MKPPLLDPCNDLVFKCLFGQSKALLTDLINALRYDQAPVEVVEILNPQVNIQQIHDKFIVLDILARDSEGLFFNVEMQMQRREEWGQRGVYYLAKTLAAQLHTGEVYAYLKPVIGIHLLAYDLFPHESQARWCFEMRDQHQPAVRLGSILQLNVVELKKWRKMKSRIYIIIKRSSLVFIKQVVYFFNLYPNKSSWPYNGT